MLNIVALKLGSQFTYLVNKIKVPLCKSNLVFGVLLYDNEDILTEFLGLVLCFLQKWGDFTENAIGTIANYLKNFKSLMSACFYIVSNINVPYYEKVFEMSSLQGSIILNLQ